MKTIVGTLTCLSIGFASDQALALVHVDVAGGQTKASYESTVSSIDDTKTISGSEYGAYLLLDPIPMIPVSFGLGVTANSVDTSSVNLQALNDQITANDSVGKIIASAKTSQSSLLYGPTFKIWAPTPYIRPYLRAGYMMGTSVSKIDVSLTATSTASDPTNVFAMKGSSKATYTGSDIAIGFDFAPIRFVSMFLEYSIQNGKVKTTSADLALVSISSGTTSTSSITTADLTDDDKKSRSSSLKSMRLGLSVGI